MLPTPEGKRTKRIERLIWTGIVITSVIAVCGLAVLAFTGVIARK